MSKINVTCRSCHRQYKVEIEDGLNYEAMDCPDCGASIPIPPAPPGDAAPEEEVVLLQCPMCKHIFEPPFDPKTHIGGMNCPNCGSGLPLPLEKNLLNPIQKEEVPDTAPATKPAGPPPAATFFFACSVLDFVIADIAAICEAPVLANSLYWSGVAFVLMAIYLKIQWK